MARINRRPSANRRSTLIDPEKTASGSMAEKFRSSILGAPGEFRDSSFDPDMASLDELRGRSGEIAKLMAPAPEELEFSDTGKIRDVFGQPDYDDIDFSIFETPDFDWDTFDPSTMFKSSMGKDVTTGRILREHPDKFKSEGDPSEPGGRFFKRVPAILRRIDPMTARSRGATGEDYGKPGGYKFLPESDYMGRSESDPYFMGI
jgi:hypothetical protein